MRKAFSGLRRKTPGEGVVSVVAGVATAAFVVFALVVLVGGALDSDEAVKGQGVTAGQEQSGAGHESPLAADVDRLLASTGQLFSDIYAIGWDALSYAFDSDYISDAVRSDVKGPLVGDTDVAADPNVHIFAEHDSFSFLLTVSHFAAYVGGGTPEQEGGMGGRVAEDLVVSAGRRGYSLVRREADGRAGGAGNYEEYITLWFEKAGGAHLKAAVLEEGGPDTGGPYLHVTLTVRTPLYTEEMFPRLADVSAIELASIVDGRYASGE